MPRALPSLTPFPVLAGPSSQLGDSTARGHVLQSPASMAPTTAWRQQRRWAPIQPYMGLSDVHGEGQPLSVEMKKGKAVLLHTEKWCSPALLPHLLPCSSVGAFLQHKLPVLLHMAQGRACGAAGKAAKRMSENISKASVLIRSAGGTLGTFLLSLWGNFPTSAVTAPTRPRCFLILLLFLFLWKCSGQPGDLY